MDKEELKQYKALKNEIKLMERKIDKLYDRAGKIPTVMGKVVGSSHSFPYTLVRTSVEIDEPKEMDEINGLIRLKEKRLDEARKKTIEIEEFISAIPDSNTRQIFELTFQDGVSQKDVAKEFAYSPGRISQIISEYLKD